MPVALIRILNKNILNAAPAPAGKPVCKAAPAVVFKRFRPAKFKRKSAMNLLDS